MSINKPWSLTDLCKLSKLIKLIALIYPSFSPEHTEWYNYSRINVVVIILYIEIACSHQIIADYIYVYVYNLVCIYSFGRVNHKNSCEPLYFEALEELIVNTCVLLFCLK